MSTEQLNYWTTELFSISLSSVDGAPAQVFGVHFYIGGAPAQVFGVHLSLEMVLLHKCLVCISI